MGRLGGYAGFTLIESLAVLVVLGVLVALGASRLVTTEPFQLQSSRDGVIAALSTAQQLAMAQDYPVRVVVGSGQIDVQRDSGGYTSIQFGGTQYPLDISPVTVLGPDQTIQFDRLGTTVPTMIDLQHGASSIRITVSASGFSQ
jgi:prepilin-type N-terminal cleavage/methylation domain-containing protein